MSDVRIVRVVFVDADGGQEVGRTELPVDQLPDTFDLETKLHLGDVTWSVQRAEPSTSAEFAATGSLILTLRRETLVSANEILYSLPTICDVLPASADTTIQGDRLEIDEDDWRQVEMVSADLVNEVDAELRAVHQIFDQHARRDDAGRVFAFAAIHVRVRPSSPLQAGISLRRLRALLPANAGTCGPVALRSHRGGVPASFTVSIGPVVLYGLADDDTVTVLGIHPHQTTTPHHGIDPAAILEGILDTFNLVLVDWCRVVTVAPAAIGQYLNAIEAG